MQIVYLEVGSNVNENEWPTGSVWMEVGGFILQQVNGFSTRMLKFAINRFVTVCCPAETLEYPYSLVFLNVVPSYDQHHLK